jgi:hypothetical protein
MPVYKVLSVEVDGTELENPTELLLSAVNTVYDNTASGLVSVNTQTAIDELSVKVDNAVVSGSVNFSYRKLTNKSITIPADQQMAVFFGLELLTGSELVIQGELILLN